jgi:endoglucanase
VIRDPQTGYDSAVDFTPGANYAVVDKATGKTVKQGAPTAWNGGATDSTSGDKVWWFDFSDVTATGTYTVNDVDKKVRSVEFDIDDNVYRSVLKHAVRMYYYQRAGFAKSAARRRDWADGASHMGSGTRFASRTPGQRRPMHRSSGSSRRLVRRRRLQQVHCLGGGYRDHAPACLRRESVGVRRRLRTLPNPATGFPIFSTKSSGPRLDRAHAEHAMDPAVRPGLGRASPVGGHRTKLLRPGDHQRHPDGRRGVCLRQQDLRRPARSEPQDLRRRPEVARAVKAWTWADANPNVLYYNNDESKQTGSSGLASGDQETDDAGRLFSKFQAAIYLYEMTGDAATRASRSRIGTRCSCRRQPDRMGHGESKTPCTSRSSAASPAASPPCHREPSDHQRGQSIAPRSRAARIPTAPT